MEIWEDGATRLDLARRRAALLPETRPAEQEVLSLRARCIPRSCGSLISSIPWILNL